MGQITQERFDKEKNYFSDVWQFRKKYAEVEENDAYWKAIVEESDQLCRKNDNSPFFIGLMLAVIFDVETRARQKNMKVPDMVHDMTNMLRKHYGLKSMEETLAHAIMQVIRENI